MKKPITHALIVAGLNPATLHAALDKVLDEQISEQQKFSKYGCRLTRHEERLQAQLWKLSTVLDEENEITQTSAGKIKTALN
jgi:hypothetical protein